MIQIAISDLPSLAEYAETNSLTSLTRAQIDEAFGIITSEGYVICQQAPIDAANAAFQAMHDAVA